MILFKKDWEDYPTAVVDYKTNNESFMKYCEVLDGMGIENNAWPFFIPSHSSTLAQPNDCRVNLNFHIAMSITTNAMCNIETEFSITAMNVMFCHAWSGFMKRDKEKYMFSAENHATRAQEYSGFSPFQKEYEACSVYLEKMNECRDLMDVMSLNKNVC